MEHALNMIALAASLVACQPQNNQVIADILRFNAEGSNSVGRRGYPIIIRTDDVLRFNNRWVLGEKRNLTTHPINDVVGVSP